MAQEEYHDLSVPAVPVDGDVDRHDHWADDRSEYRRVLSAAALTGDRVRNDVGEDLGKIEEIMIDVPSGRVAYAVLSFGGILGIGDKLFAVPWQALRLDERNHTFLLQIERRRLEESPGFDRDRWPDMSDPAWRAQLDEFYGPDRERTH